MGDIALQFVDPKIVTNQFYLRPGDVVADFGAGHGAFVEPLVQAVTTEGIVYALEIQKNLVAAVGELARQRNYANVRVLWVDLEEPQGTTLDSDMLDCAVMVNTLFQIEDSATALNEVLRTLRSGGKFFIIDWTESFNHLGPEPAAVITPADARAAAETAGFVFEREFPAGAHHYGLAFRKP